MLKQCFAGVFVFIGLATVAWSQPSREQLVAKPQYIEAVRPVFADVTPEAVRDNIHVLATRSSAAYGFNTPAITVFLPEIDNSAFAIAEFDRPNLTDKHGKQVKFEVEQGGYDESQRATEMRLVAEDGVGIIDYAVAKGSGRIRYPLVVSTSIVRVKEQPATAGEISIDGPYVTYTDKNIPELTFQKTKIGPVRAYDEQGRMLEDYGGAALETSGGITRQTLTFYGAVAEAQVDTITNWALISFSYELPISKQLPESQIGTPAFRPENIEAPAGGSVVVEIVPQETELSSEKPLPEKKQKLDANTETLHIALASAQGPESEPAIRKLIESGADVNAPDSYGRTSLYFVAYRCDQARLMQLLLEAGAEVNVTTVTGETPLWQAQAMKCEENIRLLTNKGAK